MQTTTDTIDQAVTQLERARAAYEEFQEALEALGELVREIAPFEWDRVDAYPGWHGTRDVGGGQDMIGWLYEIEDALESSAIATVA